MVRKSTETVRLLGPYWDAERKRWHFELRYADGTRERHRGSPGMSEAEAREYAEGFLAVRDSDAKSVVLTVAQAVTEYGEHLIRKGNSEATADWTRNRALVPFVGLHGERLLSRLTPAHFGSALDAMADLAMATQRSYWLATARWAAWLVKRRYVIRDLAEAYVRQLDGRDEQLPWASRAGAKAIGRGKAQLRGEDEVRAYLEAAAQLERADARAAAQLPLLCGLASGEVLHLTVGRVDFGGRAIWVDDAGEEWSVKTRSRRRSVPLPARLERDLRTLCEARLKDAWLFEQNAEPWVKADRTGGAGEGNAGEPRTPTWLRKLVTAVCRAAKVRDVSPHGLRGTWQTMLHERQRRSLAEVAWLAGHGDQGQTADRHYVAATPIGEELTMPEPRALGDDRPSPHSSPTRAEGKKKPPESL